MYTVFSVPKRRDPNQPEQDVVSVSMKLFGDDAKRWRDIFKQARRNDPEVEKTDVIRFLMELPTKRQGFLSEADRRKFRVSLALKGEKAIAVDHVDLGLGNEHTEKRAQKLSRASKPSRVTKQGRR